MTASRRRGRVSREGERVERWRRAERGMDDERDFSSDGWNW